MTHTTTVHPLDTGSPSGVSKHNQGKDLPEEGNTTLTRDPPRLNFHRSRDPTGSSAGGSTSAQLPKPGSNALILRSKLQAQRSSQRAHSSCEDEEEEVAQLCLTLCDPRDCSLPGSSVHGIFQARVLEWVAIAFSRGSSPTRDRTQVSCIAGRRLTVWAVGKSKAELEEQRPRPHKPRAPSAPATETPTTLPRRASDWAHSNTPSRSRAQLSRPSSTSRSQATTASPGKCPECFEASAGKAPKRAWLLELAVGM